MNMNITMRSLLRGTVMATALAGVAGAAAAPAAVPVTAPATAIAPQPLISALNEFVTHTGLQVVYRSEIAAGKRSRGAASGLPPRKMLEQLLRDTGLEFEFVNDSTVTIRSGRGGGGSTTAGPAGHMQVALNAQTAVSAAAEQQNDERQITVQDTRLKTASELNADRPRTVDDVQAYHIFDAESISRSGSVTVGDFLKQHLTMNASWAMPGIESGISTPYNNRSTVDLRGVGADKTLILVNGRRQPSPVLFGTSSQTDLNRIPIGSIERIEVLPSSASGIYGGSAIGGVINVILKRDFSGGEVQANYASPSSSGAYTATMSASYGTSLENGRSQLRFSALWSDGESLRLGERRELYLSNLAQIRRNAPGFLASQTIMTPGVLPNIAPASSLQTTLTLKNGTVISSPYTFVAAGTSPGTTAAQLYASLAANGGRWSEGMADNNTQAGTQARLGLAPRSDTLSASLRREMLPWLSLFADLSHTRRAVRSTYNPMGQVITTVPVNAASNPFTTAVWVHLPTSSDSPQSNDSRDREAVAGVEIRLPGRWSMAFDYGWYGTDSHYSYFLADSAALNADMISGVFNPFVDTRLYPLSANPYLASVNSTNRTTVREYALRGGGPVTAWPWGEGNVNFGLQRTDSDTGEQQIDWLYARTPNNTSFDRYFSKRAVARSAYIEAHLPLLPRELRFAHDLQLQVAGRTERYDVQTGTNGIRRYYLRNPPTVTFLGGLSLNGQSVFDDASYDSDNFTLGFKYQPVPGLTLRASRATAFLPPTPTQLSPSNAPSTTPTSVVDPRTGGSVPVTTIGGGNSALTPQGSDSTNAGVIWEPRTGWLGGARLNLEYYRIEQSGFIASLTAQEIVNNESLYPDRVTRNSSGVITQVNITLDNLYRRETEGFDLNIDVTRATRLGNVSFRLAETLVLHSYNQFSLTLPEVDSVGFPSDGGALKRRRNLSFGLQRGDWEGGWTVRYFGSYGQIGRADSPQVVRQPQIATASYNRYVLPQGSGTIPSQTYHDLFVGYSPRRSSGPQSGLLSGVSLQLGVRNVFDQAPPLDIYSVYQFFTSQFGDFQLRSYWLNARKQF